MRLFPNVTSNMLTVDYWLSRLDNPDAPLLSPELVAAFNAHVRAVLNFPHPLDLPDTLDADNVRVLMPSTQALFEKTLYDIDGSPLSAATLNRLAATAETAMLPARVPVRWGLVIRRVHLRMLPTEHLVLKKPGDLYFDQLQEAALDVGWSVAVLHATADDQWYFVLSPLGAGWLHAGAVALGDAVVVREYANAASFLTVTGTRASVALPDGEYAEVQMGTQLPLVCGDGSVRRLSVPRCDAEGRLRLVEGFIPAEDPDWHEGDMPCTLRTIYIQAFRMLNEPYAWGGSRMGLFGRDCSRFVHDIWAVTGVRLPRNSGWQGKVCAEAAVFDEDDSIAARVAALAGVPSGALLFMPGHVMLYLGQVDDIPYAIHDVWGYMHPDGHYESIRAVTVTDLPVAPAAQPNLMTRLTHAGVIGYKRQPATGRLY